MSNIAIHNKNHVHLKVDAEPSIAQELNDYFSFDVPGAKFHPLYRSKMWDGKVRLYSMFTKELYVGLIDYVRKFADEFGYTIDESNYTKYGYDVTFEEVSDFCNNLNIGSKGEPLTIREYQLDAIYQAIVDGRRLLLSPTGSGKSLIIYCLMRWHETFGRRQLIIVPTTSLVEQMFSDFQDYSCLNQWKAVEQCHKIYSGSEKSNQYPVVISTWQSIYKLPKQFFADFHTMYGDEAHLFKAKSLTTIFNKCTNTPYRIGTTGTLDGTKTHKLILEGMFGPVFKVTTTKKLMDNNQLANLKIFAILLQYPEEVRKSVKTLKYQEEMDFIVNYDKRNKFIRNLAIDQKGNTLLLFQYVEKHGKILFDLIEDKADDNRKVFFVSGATDTSDREAIRKITEKQSDAIIVASLGTFSTGINIRNLHNIIFASPSKSQIRVLQSIGRGLRKSDDGRTTQLYDISDDISSGSRQNFALLHSYERLKMYKAENFIYKTYEVEI